MRPITEGVLTFFAVIVGTAALSTTILCCLPVPTPSPTPTPGHPPTLAGACAQLADLACDEGGPTCILDLDKTSQLTVVDLECIAGAESKPEVRLCPGIRGEGACP